MALEPQQQQQQQQQLFTSARMKDLPTLRLLLEDPELEVNWGDPVHLSRTPLHQACENGCVEAVKLLLQHPNIRVNERRSGGETPFLLACWNGHEEVVKEMLKDPRVDINLADNFGATPLWHAADCSRQQVLRWLIASDKKLDATSGMVRGITPLDVTKARGTDEAVALLTSFIDHPEETRRQVKTELRIVEALVRSIFALMTVICGGYLRVAPGLEEDPVGRFFRCAARLPTELQMLLANRAAGSSKDFIQTKITSPNLPSDLQRP